MDNETTQKDISDKIKKATKNLNQYIFKTKKMGLTIGVTSHAHIDVFGKEAIGVKVLKITEL